MTKPISTTFGSQSTLGLCFLSSLTVFALLSITPALAQTTSTWSGGAGNWSPCPNQSGTALWDTCNANPPAFPDGNYNAVIMGGPVNATGASVVNLSIGTGDVLNIAGTTYVDITGPSVVNNGSIILTSGNGFQFEGNIISTLSGTGSVQMNNSAVRFWGGNGTPTLNLQQPITGQGSILGLGSEQSEHHHGEWRNTQYPASWRGPDQHRHHPCTIRQHDLPDRRGTIC